MKLLAVTRPDFYEGETALVGSLFSLGLERLHLRKPGATQEQLAAWLEEVPEQYRRRIVLHDWHDLVRELGLGGVHLNGRNPEPPRWLAAAREDYSLSRSCHSIAELRGYHESCDYLLLSPIFDSISKEGYGAAYTAAELKAAAAEGLLGVKTYALGGVSPERIPALKELGFYGAAVLGGLWGSSGDGSVLEVFESYRRVL